MTHRPLTIWDVVRITGGRLVRAARSIDGAIGRAVIDSREVEAGDLFVAIAGERTDGHRFVGDALARGAALAIITRRSLVSPGLPKDDPGGVLEVDDARAALARLASRFRDRIGGGVIAVTGSCGKTTTVRMLEAALSPFGRGTASRKSFNNDLGVPITLLGARTDDAFVVCEVGTNERGEIEALAKIVRPDVAVFTMVGRAHLGGFSSQEELQREKGDLAAHVRAGGLVVVNEDAPPLLAPTAPGVRTVSFGRMRGRDFRAEEIRHEGGSVGCVIRGHEYRVPMPGEHNAVNAAGVVAVARSLGLSRERIAEALAGTAPPPMRMQVQSLGGVRVINDAYNANPESMAAAIDTLAALADGARVAVLGDMRELGREGPAAHDEIVCRAGRLGARLIVVVGPEMGAAAARAGVACEAFDAIDDERARAIAARFEAGDTVLLKGSRAMGLERVGEAWAELVSASAVGRSK